jgi:hypothetical protein
MKTSYTEGPWQTMPEECGKDYIRIRGTVLGGRYKVANVVTPVYQGADGRELAETRANAALIAAAPDLYEALASIENDDGRIPATIWDMRNAALAKSRGET